MLVDLLLSGFKFVHLVLFFLNFFIKMGLIVSWKTISL